MRKWRILIVDDDASYRKLFTYQLTKEGFEVFIAHDGQQALDWLTHPAQRPDLMVLDLLLPRLSGIEVLERIKTFPFNLPVILISGAELPIARQGILQGSPTAFLAKPFDLQDLLTKIHALLRPEAV